MVTKSHGPRRRTREKFRGPKKLTVNRLLRNFETGQRVAIVISSNSRKGVPFRRFHGLSGVITGKRGKSYIVEIKDINKIKQVITPPEHIKLLK